MAIIFQYPFNTTAKNQLDNSNTQDPDVARSDVSRHGDWLSNGLGWEIKSAAAYSNGSGLGLRQYRDGHNGVSGGIACTLSSGTFELWFRFYLRFELGFPWVGNSPSYTKDIYGHDTSGSIWWIYGHQGGGWGIADFIGGTTTFSNPAFNWAWLMGGNTGDGLWHCHEFHIKRGAPGAGIVEIWVDNVQCYSQSGLTLSNNNMTDFWVGENQGDVAATPNSPTTGGTSWVVDYDEIVVSNSARVGPLVSAGTPSTFARRSQKIWAYKF